VSGAPPGFAGGGRRRPRAKECGQILDMENSPLVTDSKGMGGVSSTAGITNSAQESAHQTSDL
jgi:hypothetical protein